MSGQVHDHALVKIVQEYPILYDKDLSRGQRNSELKDRAWQEVSQKMSASERACITRWKSIRDRFGKEYRRVQEHPNEPTSWDMFPHLLFLKNHYKHGCARNDPLVDIKYKPKQRKTRKSRLNNDSVSQCEDKNHNEDDIDPDELMVNQQLIALVKLHPVLYDKYMIRDSKNLTAKNDAWKDISESLGLSEELCYKRWKKLRDRFSREYRYIKISPEKPVMWVYFQDLMFLEDHYRKGVPLNVDTLKRCRPPAEENPWGNDYSVDSNSSLREQIEEEHMTASTETESFSDTIHQQSMDELLIIPDRDETTQVEQKYNVTQPVPTSSITIVETTDTAEPEQKLGCVISNIETVLRDSQECLRALQQQNQQHKQQIENNMWRLQPDMLQKMIVLLGGLSDEERKKAERKILQFLYECQIKIINNEEIEDVGNVQIY